MAAKDDLAPELRQVARELETLMRSKRSELIGAASFPAICEAPRVRSEARRLDVKLDTTHDIRRVLDGVLAKRQEEERQSDAIHDRPLAEPMKILLGIEPTTGEMGVMERSRLAARPRTVSVATMVNKHKPIIAREFAAYLLEPELPEDSVFERVLAADDLTVALDALSQGEARRLAVETVESHRDFYLSLARLYLAADEHVDQAGEGSWSVRDEALAALHGFASSPSCDLYWLWYFTDFMDEKEDPDLPSRFLWLVAVFGAARGAVPKFQGRELHLLLHASAEAGPNLHVFLEALEKTEVGLGLIENWLELFQPRTGETPHLTDTHMRCLGAWAAAELLIHPSELGKQAEWCLARYLARYGLSGDKAQIAGAVRVYWKGATKSDLPRIHDSPEDREFLRCASGPDGIDIYDVGLTLEGLVTKHLDKHH
jgi:hypothetical protein